MAHTSFVSTTLLAAISVALLAACGGSKTTPAGQAPTPAPQSAARASGGTGIALPTGVTKDMVAEGDSIFNNASCQRCHGKGGKGSENGPDLSAGKFEHISGSYDEIVKIITTGVPAAEIKHPEHPYAMRARGGVQPLLTDAQVRAVAAYVFTISHP
jgi:mono/diheme cytochrome c family protein